MCIRYSEGDDEADRSVADLCANITTLDLGGNLFETWDEILLLARLFPKLHSLTLDGNRLSNTVSTHASGLPNIRYLGLANTLLEPAEIASITSSLPELQTLILTNNELEEWEPRTDTSLPPTVHSIDLSKNDFTTLTSLAGIFALPRK
jgi:Leucine-rich repeat (LRR) protein